MRQAPPRRSFEDLLDRIEDLAEDALDAELTRGELVAKVKELADLASGEAEEEEEERGRRKTEQSWTDRAPSASDGEPGR